ncbi:hypothetical protein L6452_24496 [Arctium lappa]|uniref:Uncharacterized protein n=1 Tax=Arctium lappa TaxID=4217 RepID=A0ACB9AA40_ARCLA|nr:hypothetical protein L6452_24496 [Arctium lappa]
MMPKNPEIRITVPRPQSAIRNPRLQVRSALAVAECDGGGWSWETGCGGKEHEGGAEGIQGQGSLPESCRSSDGVREGRRRDKREEDVEIEGDEDAGGGMNSGINMRRSSGGIVEREGQTHFKKPVVFRWTNFMRKEMKIVD